MTAGECPSKRLAARDCSAWLILSLQRPDANCPLKQGRPVLGATYLAAWVPTECRRCGRTHRAGGRNATPGSNDHTLCRNESGALAAVAVLEVQSPYAVVLPRNRHVV